MKDNFVQEIIVSSILVVMLFLFLNPFSFWMPSAALMIMILIFLIAFVIFASFFWKEKSRDEREDFHKLLAGRSAFLIGAGVLVIGIVAQSFRHEIDPWLIVTLASMIIAKVIGLIYGKFRH